MPLFTFCLSCTDANPWQIPNWRRPEGPQKEDYPFFARWSRLYIISCTTHWYDSHTVLDLSAVSTSKRKAMRHFHAHSKFVGTTRDSIALPTTFHCFNNSYTPSRPNQLVVCLGSGSPAERDLSNLINSLWAWAEESSEEILCLTSCTAQVLQVLFLSLCKPKMGWTVFPHTQQTACTVVLFSRHLNTDINRQL